MKYLVLLTIRIEKFPQYFIEVGTQLDLCIHPNLTDEITVDEYFCSIKRVSYDLKNDNGMLYIEAHDSLPHEDQEENVVPRLKDEAEELKQHGWWLNDYDFGDLK